MGHSAKHHEHHGHSPSRHEPTEHAACCHAPSTAPVPPAGAASAWTCPFYERAVSSVRNRHLNMFTLIGLGVCVAFGFSVVATLAPGVFPAEFGGQHGEVATYFEAASVITALALLGQVLELRARSRTGDAVRKLLRLAPAVARRLAHDGTEGDVPIDEVHVGDRLRVRPGDKIPVDAPSSMVEASWTRRSSPANRFPSRRARAIA